MAKRTSKKKSARTTDKPIKRSSREPRAKQMFNPTERRTGTAMWTGANSESLDAARVIASAIEHHSNELRYYMRAMDESLREISAYLPKIEARLGQVLGAPSLPVNQPKTGSPAPTAPIATVKGLIQPAPLSSTKLPTKTQP